MTEVPITGIGIGTSIMKELKVTKIHSKGKSWIPVVIILVSLTLTLDKCKKSLYCLFYHIQMYANQLSQDHLIPWKILTKYEIAIFDTAVKIKFFVRDFFSKFELIQIFFGNFFLFFFFLTFTKEVFNGKLNFWCCVSRKGLETVQSPFYRIFIEKLMKVYLIYLLWKNFCV